VIAAVVSGLPLLHLPDATRRSLLTRALAAQGPGGLFIQLSYSWRPPVKAGEGVTLTKRAIWQNFPPAHVWTYMQGSGYPLTRPSPCRSNYNPSMVRLTGLGPALGHY
jgi:phospholipid N-methyltransferase